MRVHKEERRLLEHHAVGFAAGGAQRLSFVAIRALCRDTVHLQPANLLREAVDPLTVRRA